MLLRQVGLAVVGADVSVDVEDPDRVGVSVAGPRARSAAGRTGSRRPAAPAVCARFDLRRAVQADQPAKIGLVDPGQALGAGLSDQRREHQREQQRPSP